MCSRQVCCGCLTLSGATLREMGWRVGVALLSLVLYLVGVLSLCICVMVTTSGSAVVVALAWLLAVCSLLAVVAAPVVVVLYYCTRLCERPGFVMPCARRAMSPNVDEEERFIATTDEQEDKKEGEALAQAFLSVV